MSAHNKKHIVTDIADHTGSVIIGDANKVLATDGLGGLFWTTPPVPTPLVLYTIEHCSDAIDGETWFQKIGAGKLYFYRKIGASVYAVELTEVACGGGPG